MTLLICYLIIAGTGLHWTLYIVATLLWLLRALLVSTTVEE